jgi:DNA-directed RNA polymerase specialized sigma24 family protein
MPGSMAYAEDAVQETYLRRHAAAHDTVPDPKAFLMTTAMRICLDMLTSARTARGVRRSVAARAGSCHAHTRTRAGSPGAQHGPAGAFGRH